jgi:sugar (pentulose or hexulose) kinase
MCAMKVVGDTFQLVDDAGTTLIAGPTDERLYALEDTIGPAASRVLPVISQPDVLRDVLQKLSVEVAASLQPMLTPTDRRIIIDGGISQAAQLPEIQSKVLGGIEVVRQNHFEATAMGVAKLTFDRNFQSSLS